MSVGWDANWIGARSEIVYICQIPVNDFSCDCSRNFVLVYSSDCGGYRFNNKEVLNYDYYEISAVDIYEND